MIDTDGYKFKLYIEGIRVPFISANINYQKYISMATIDMHPSKNFKAIPSGSLVTIFFKKLGLDDKYKLLYMGTVAGKGINIQGGNRNYTLSSYGRLSITNNIILSSIMKSDFASHNVKAMRGGYQLSDIEAAKGAASLKVFENTAENVTDVKTDTSAYGAVVNVSKDQENYTDPTSQEKLQGDTNVAAQPAGKIAIESVKKKEATKKQPLSIDNPNIIKDILDNIIYDAMSSSSEFNKISYSYRVMLENFLNEFPPAWANNVASWPKDKKDKFQAAFDQAIVASLNGSSSLSRLIELILRMYYAEMWEIPGLAIGGALVMPDLITSDIPACNMIFPSERSSVQITDNDANKVTRVVCQSHPMNMKQDISDNKTNSTHRNVSYVGLSVYPDMLDNAEALRGDDTLANKTQQIMVEGEEFIGSRPKFTGYPADYLSSSITADVQQDFTEQYFYTLKDAHRNANVELHFSPYLIPGQRAILFDQDIPIIFKIASLSHNISNSGSLATSIRGTQVEYLDEAIYRHPHWFDVSYKKENIHEVYKAYFGCTSFSDSAGTPGDISAAYDFTFEKYINSNTKSYMAQKITERYMDSEEAVFNLLGASAKQQDSEGAIIYESKKVFDRIIFKGYDYNGNPKDLINDRQTPILEYVKTIYGVVGDTYV